jgi:hypothetical protein
MALLGSSETAKWFGPSGEKLGHCGCALGQNIGMGTQSFPLTLCILAIMK